MPLDWKALRELKEQAVQAAGAMEPEAETPPASSAPSSASLAPQVLIPIADLQDFPAERHHFRPASPQRLEILRKNIAENGILSPLLVRPMGDGWYQILAGHNRRTVARLLGYMKVPCLIKDVQDEDEAEKIMISDNLMQRSDLLPSERAFSYERLFEIEQRRQGQRTDITSGHGGQKLDLTRDTLDEDVSGRSVSRYLRLVKLIPPLLEKVDAKALGLAAAADSLSFMTKEAQQTVFTYFFVDSKKQKIDKGLAADMRAIDADPDKVLDGETIDKLIAARKDNRNFRQVKIPMKDIRRYFYPGTTQEEVQEVILKAIESYFEGK